MDLETILREKRKAILEVTAKHGANQASLHRVIRDKVIAEARPL